MRTRPVIWSSEQIRSFDFGSAMRDVVTGFGDLAMILFGSALTRISKFTPTADSPADLSVNFDEGWILSYGPIDESDFGALPADDSNALRLGYSAAQSLLFDVSDLSVGQNKWALVYVDFEVDDSIRQGDPDDGVPKFWDSANPLVALEGEGGSGLPSDTVRAYVAKLHLIYGTAASTGTEVPPTAPAGAAPAFMVDLTHGQTSIAQNQILVAGPGIGPNTSSYPNAPFAAGLYTQHHKGGAGQAPPIDLTTEVTGILPFANLPTTGSQRLVRVTGGTADPNGTAGNKWDLYIQVSSTDRILWECEADAGTVWKTIKATAAGGGTSPPVPITSFPGTIAASGIFLASITVDSDTALPAASGNFVVTVARTDSTNGARLRLLPHSGDTIMGLTEYFLDKGGDSVTLASDTGIDWRIVGEYIGA